MQSNPVVFYIKFCFHIKISCPKYILLHSFYLFTLFFWLIIRPFWTIFILVFNHVCVYWLYVHHSLDKNVSSFLWPRLLFHRLDFILRYLLVLDFLLKDVLSSSFCSVILFSFKCSATSFCHLGLPLAPKLVSGSSDVSLFPTDYYIYLF